MAASSVQSGGVRRSVDHLADHGLLSRIEPFRQQRSRSVFADARGLFDFRPGRRIGGRRGRRALRRLAQHAINLREFRVDNPHTKPFGFWEWLIGTIRVERPGTVFLSEAFTRPAVMKRLAKVGFSQSYTYFTWRHSKYEIESYLTERLGPC